MDLARRRIILNKTKNDERRAVPIVGAAFDRLKSLSKVRRLDSRLLFPGSNPAKPIEIRVPWLSALEKAGIRDFRFHDLRHTAASDLAMNGATLAEIAEILGHKTFQMVKRYAHLSESHTASVVERMNDKIFGRTAGDRLLPGNSSGSATVGHRAAHSGRRPAPFSLA